MGADPMPAHVDFWPDITHKGQEVIQDFIPLLLEVVLETVIFSWVSSISPSRCYSCHGGPVLQPPWPESPPPSAGLLQPQVVSQLNTFRRPSGQLTHQPALRSFIPLTRCASVSYKFSDKLEEGHADVGEQAGEYMSVCLSVYVNE